MSGIDLIPASYRRRATLRRSGRHVVMAGAALFFVFSGCLLGLLWSTHTEETAIAAYQAQADRTASLQEDIRHLSEKRLKLEQALSVLSATRGANELPNALQALDAALNDGVWLQGLQIERQREKVEAAPSVSDGGTASANPFALVQYGNERWTFRRTLQINGMATSYNAVADFIQSLASQPGMQEVRFLNSGVTPGAQGPLLTFSASAILLPVEGPLP